jgi:hypothetical protein
MKPRLILSLFPILLAMLVFSGDNKAEAASGISISIGGSRHRARDGGVVYYRTADPGYSTWYPTYTTTRDYPTVYRSTTYYESDGYQTSPYYYGTYDTPYEYRAPSVDFNVWFGSDGRRHYGRSSHRR